MRLVSVDEMRELDRRTIEEHGTPGEVLMDRAGQGVAEVIHFMATAAGLMNPLVDLVAGRGNNGGDAFVAARYLSEMGYDVQVLLAGNANEMTGDALKHLSLMKDAGVSLHELPTKEDWESGLNQFSRPHIIVDGILGTGTSGPARGPAVGAIEYINALSEDAWVISIDVPSGLNADTGVAEGEAVKADVTVTMGLPKNGLVESSAVEYVGNLEVVDIGIPGAYFENTGAEVERALIDPSDLHALLPRRRRASHKGDYGKILLIGGAQGYAGAITMAARSAVRAGAGLVHVLVPEGIANIVAGSTPEVMVSRGPETEIGSLSADLWKEWRTHIDDFDAILIGPGMTRHQDTFAIARQMMRECSVPLVVDADAISVFAGQPHWIEKAQCPVVITPHPGELARLFGQEIADIQANRWEVAIAAAKHTDATVILKGAGTLVAQVGKPVCINMTGNPGMATGGSGDVLAGLLAGLLGQGLSAYDASCVSVYLHGRAGDIGALQKSQAGLSATDIIENIPFAFRDLTVR
ncbi:MAG: NAD(P)H-hydrate dehydratase [Verrucomicrobia bacterium]|nr:NAD(P)H-hydrate dehydratase [Verrucomicrobiota bacterium]